MTTNSCLKTTLFRPTVRRVKRSLPVNVAIRQKRRRSSVVLPAKQEPLSGGICVNTAENGFKFRVRLSGTSASFIKDGSFAVFNAASSIDRGAHEIGISNRRTPEKPSSTSFLTGERRFHYVYPLHQCTHHLLLRFLLCHPL